MKFNLSMVRTKVRELEQHVIDISASGHEYYGKDLIRDAPRQFLQPKSATVSEVVDWLTSEGVYLSDIVLGPRSCLTFQIPLSQAQTLLETTFNYFHSEATNTTRIRTLQYSVPRNLRGLVQAIQPTTQFVGPSAQANMNVSDSASTSPLTPMTSADIEEDDTLPSVFPKVPLQERDPRSPGIGGPPNFAPRPTDNPDDPCWHFRPGHVSCMFGVVPTTTPSRTSIFIIQPQTPSYTPTIFDPYPVKMFTLQLGSSVTVTASPTSANEGKGEGTTIYNDSAT